MGGLRWATRRMPLGRTSELRSRFLTDGRAQSGCYSLCLNSSVSVTQAYFSSPTGQIIASDGSGSIVEGIAAIVGWTGIGMDAIHMVSDTDIMKAGTELFSRVG